MQYSCVLYSIQVFEQYAASKEENTNEEVTEEVSVETSRYIFMFHQQSAEQIP
jgi:hypothetical protein